MELALKPQGITRQKTEQTRVPPLHSQGGFLSPMETQQVMLHKQQTTTLHPVPLTIARKLQQGFVGVPRA